MKQSCSWDSKVLTEIENITKEIGISFFDNDKTNTYVFIYSLKFWIIYTCTYNFEIPLKKHLTNLFIFKQAQFE